MPLNLIGIDQEVRILMPGDQGFLFSAKLRYLKNLSSHSRKWLNRYTQRYYEARCPEEAAVKKAEVQAKVGEEEQKNGEEEGGANDGEEEPQPKEIVLDTGIVFVERSMVYDTSIFVACNLEDPADYLQFVFYTMAEAKGSDKKTKFPLRVMPVHAVCEARAKSVETVALPLVEKYLGQDGTPFRFSITYKGSMDGEHLSQKEAGSVVRNCIWSVNPNCVQCIKFQDYAFLVDILDPLFCIGVGKDFNKLAGYNTAGIRHGLDLRDEDEDSEDDISDDPTLDEEEEKRRKLRIKRKRRAAKTGLSRYNGNAKGIQDDDDDDNDDGEEEVDGLDDVGEENDVADGNK